MLNDCEWEIPPCQRTNNAEATKRSNICVGARAALLQEKTVGKSVAERVYLRLRRAIINGEIPARTRLIEVEIAKTVGTSRTPVREAISRLIIDRLVVSHSSGGVEVTDTHAELDDIYRIREALEGCAARFAAERASALQLARLRTLVEATRGTPADELATRVRINDEFHEIVCNASGSERLIQMIDRHREFFIGEQGLGRFRPRESAQALRDHEGIVDALCARDGKRAERLVRRHLEHSRKGR